MAEPYSNDLRRKFFEVYDSGGISLKQLAQRFRVSESWAKKLSARRSKSGQIEMPSWQHGPMTATQTALCARAASILSRQRPTPMLATSRKTCSRPKAMRSQS